MITKGLKGSLVKDLQKALRSKGFTPGAIDGVFGKGTLAAVKAFQQSEGLLADGLAGPRTLKCLGLVKMAKKVSKESKFSSSKISDKAVVKLFPGAPKSNIKKFLPSVLKELNKSKLNDPSMTMMALATIRAESAGFAPISEYKSKYNTSPGGHPFDLYDNRKDLGNRGEPDGDRYKGRGFIQLTGRANYQRIGKKIGLGDELENNPDLANDPEVAAKILVAFLADKERRIKEALMNKDLKMARRLVNGGSHGLSVFKKCYKSGIKTFV